MTNFHFLEPDLKDYSGHYFITAKLISQTLSKDANLNEVKLYVSDDCEDNIKKELGAISVFNRRPRFIKYGILSIFWSELQKIRYILGGLVKLKDHLSTNDEIVYFNTALWTHLLSIMLFQVLNKEIRWRYIVTLRFSNRFDGKKSRRKVFYDLIFRFLRNSHLDIKYVTDSILLKREFEDDYGISVFVLPIPHVPIQVECDLISKEGKNITISALGPARDNKGSLKFLDALSILDKISFVNKSRIKIIFHIFGELRDELKRELIKLTSLQIEIIDTLRDEKEYNQDLNRSDVIFCGYDDRMYAASTSGIFFECCALNKIPIICANTWSYHIHKTFNLAEVVLFDGTNIAEKIEKLVGQDIEILKSNIKISQLDFTSHHGIDNFCQELKHVLNV